MAMLDELEAALRAKWDRDTLAVYADHLQSLGEVRGELIVIDLRIEEVGPLPELVTRRKELLATWLATLPPGKVMHGFLDVDATGANPVQQVRAALASPAAAYIRTVAIVGAPKTIRDAVKVIASAPRVGLARIVLRQWDEDKARYTLSPSETKALWHAVPDLDTIELDGYGMCSDVAHGNLRRIRTCGVDACESLLADATARWEALEEIDFAFVNHLGRPRDAERPTRILSLKRFPKLHTLDFSRCEPGFTDPNSLGGRFDVIGTAVNVPVLRQLRTLRLPILGKKSHAVVQKALEGMPDLEELVVRGDGWTFDHPKARVTLI